MVKKCMLEVFNQGVNYFDIVEVYVLGECEKVFGEVICDFGFRCSDIVVFIKFFWGGFGFNDIGFFKKYLFEGMCVFFSCLGMEYVDIVMVYCLDGLIFMEEIVRVFI